MTAPQVTCAGIAVYDVLAQVEFPLPVGLLQDIAEPSYAEGGCAVRTARALAAAGVPTRLVAPVGNDDGGRFLRQSVAGPDLSVEWINSDLATSMSLILVDKGERTILHHVGANATLTAEDILARMTGHFLHVGGACVLPGLDGRPLADLFRAAQTRGITTSLDVVHRGHGSWPNLEPLLAWTDIFCPSRVEAAAITGHQDPADAAAALHDAGVKYAVVTDGEYGSWIDHAQHRGHSPAIQVDTVDSTGAGDAFTAGMLLGVVHGRPPQDVVRLASAMGALATTTIGTYPGPPDPRQPWRLANLEAPQ